MTKEQTDTAQVWVDLSLCDTHKKKQNNNVSYSDYFDDDDAAQNIRYYIIVVIPNAHALTQLAFPHLFW
jgi:hypothetical protein